MKPTSTLSSIKYFLTPALLLFATYHFAMPELVYYGINPFTAWFLALLFPMVCLLLASLYLVYRETKKLNFETLKDRFRLKKLNYKTLAISIVSAMIIFFTMEILKKAEANLIEINYITLPDVLKLINEMFNDLAGNWTKFSMISLLLVFNIIGEEFYFRGYILPKQELVFKNYTWLIHGILWSFFHIFKWWEMIGLIPLTMLLPFIVQKTKNTTVGIMIHSLINGITIVNILPVVIQS